MPWSVFLQRATLSLLGLAIPVASAIIIARIMSAQEESSAEISALFDLSSADTTIHHAGEAPAGTEAMACLVGTGAMEDAGRRNAWVMACERLVLERPHDAQVRRALARSLLAQRDFSAAEQAFARAIALQPMDAEAWVGRAVCALARDPSTTLPPRVVAALRLAHCLDQAGFHPALARIAHELGSQSALAPALRAAGQEAVLRRSDRNEHR